MSYQTKSLMLRLFNTFKQTIGFQRSRALPVKRHMVQKLNILVRDAAQRLCAHVCVCVCGQAEVTLIPLKPALLMRASVQWTDI